MMASRGLWLGAGLALVAGLGAAMETSCSSTTTNLVVRTFERAQRMDVVCMRVLDDAGNAIAPVPALQAQCAPVASGQSGAALPYHLFAGVTQSLRGELAVVDLTAGAVIDVSSTTPGVNFLPVGQLPTDVAAVPDGTGLFVATAEVEKPAIYALPSTSLLGDSFHVSDAAYADAGIGRPQPVGLASWPVCQLPQAPSNMVVLPKTPGDGGAATGYQLIVVLPGNASQTAKVVSLDVAQFNDPTKVPPGGGTASSIPPCALSSAIELSNDLPASWAPGPTWANGLPYAPDVDLTQVTDAGTVTVTSGDASTIVPAVDRKLPGQPGCDSPDAATPTYALKRPVGERAHASALAAAGSTLYVADDALPVIHVLDASNPTSVRELPPLLVTSARDPARVVTVKSIAVSPTTRDFKRFLYAVDRDEGSIIVYDVTDVTSPHVPLSKPNPELNPFQPPDRIIFSVPVAALSFVRHDIQLTQSGNSGTIGGVLCSPNPTLDPNDPAAKYRPSGGASLDLSPTRLRGVFAFATLSNGQVVTIDVDDWDAPCRRPTYLDGKTHVSTTTSVGQHGDLAITQLAGAGPYEAPTASNGSTLTSSDEWFFPAIAPHRPRSLYFYRNDVNGNHVPNVAQIPQLLENGAQASTSSLDAKLLSPIGVEDLTKVTDPSKVTASLALAGDDPVTHLDQDWSVTFEGALPNFDGFAGTLGSNDGYATVTLGIEQGGICSRGVEDARLAHERVMAMAAENPYGLPVEADRRLGDYVQLTDEVLPPADPYWTLDNACWTGDFKTNVSTRQNACATYFGTATGSTPSPNRDFPIVAAYDDHVVLGQYDYKNADARSPAGHIRAASTNPTVMRLAQCCFHNQAHFKVRTGGEWVTSGSSVGVLSHLVADPTTRLCVSSCKGREALLNARMPELSVQPLGEKQALKEGAALDASLDARNSAYVMRNPFFATWMWTPQVPNATDPKQPVYTYSVRDAAWRFSLRGGFVPQTINLTSSTTAVVPQSMRFIESLGQLAIVDGASQGLMLIDLNTLTFAHAPYY